MQKSLLLVGESRRLSSAPFIFTYLWTTTNIWAINNRKSLTNARPPPFTFTFTHYHSLITFVLIYYFFYYVQHYFPLAPIGLPSRSILDFSFPFFFCFQFYTTFFFVFVSEIAAIEKWMAELNGQMRRNAGNFL